MKKYLLAVLLTFGVHGARADETAAVAEDVAPVVEVVEHSDLAVTPPPEVVAEPAVEPAKAPVFAVILPERIDHAWYWIFYTDTAQHIVQSAIEKALVRAGLDVIEINPASLPTFGSDMERLMSMAYALDAGKQIKADYVITGKATAVMASQGSAYGVNVFRSQAEIVAKIVRVSDGKIIALEDASHLEGGQSAQAAGQAALKKAGSQIAGKIARAARGLVSGEPAAQ